MTWVRLQSRVECESVARGSPGEPVEEFKSAKDYLGPIYFCSLANLLSLEDSIVKDFSPGCRPLLVTAEPAIDLNSGYVLRALHTLPRQGSKTPWRVHQNYVKDLSMFRFGRVDDGTMEFKAAP